MVTLQHLTMSALALVALLLVIRTFKNGERTLVTAKRKRWPTQRLWQALRHDWVQCSQKLMIVLFVAAGAGLAFSEVENRNVLFGAVVFAFVVCRGMIVWLDAEAGRLRRLEEAAERRRAI